MARDRTNYALATRSKHTCARVRIVGTCGDGVSQRRGFLWAVVAKAIWGRGPRTGRIEATVCRHGDVSHAIAVNPGSECPIQRSRWSMKRRLSRTEGRGVVATRAIPWARKEVPQASEFVSGGWHTTSSIITHTSFRAHEVCEVSKCTQESKVSDVGTAVVPLPTVDQQMTIR